MKKRVRAKKSIATDAVANDAFTNAAARMGFGSASVAEGADYTLERWSNDYWLMITLFRNHWISRRIVEKPSQDMCKAWPRIKSDSIDADLMKKFDRVVNRTYTPARIQKGLKWARLFGGAGCLMVIDGHEDILDEPLDLDDVAPGSYKGLITFDRWSGIYPEGNVATDINSPIDFGMPEFYKVSGQSGDTSFLVHHSRILRFAGPDVPAPEHGAAQYWGISELEIAYEEIRKRDNMSWSILQLLFRAQILTQKNPELAQLLSGAAMSAKAAQQFHSVMQAQNDLLSNQSMLILGKDADLQSHQYTFGGVSEIYQQFQMDIAGAARIPVSILFGRTATGLSQSSDADIRIYEQEIAQKQHEELEPQLHKLYPVVCMSEFGEVPDDLDIDFPSVRVLTEEEKAKLAKDGGDLIVAYYGAGVMTQKTAMQEAKKLADVTGIGGNITDEQIEAADDNVNLALEMQQQQMEADAAGAQSEPAANDAAFNESDHPRDENGKFGSGAIAKKLGYKIVNHPSEDSYSKSPGYYAGTAGYTDSTRKEIHLNTQGKSKNYADHYLHHEVGHVVDYSRRNVDGFTLESKPSSQELKNVAKVFETDYNMRNSTTLKKYKNSTKEIMAEAFAIYQQNPERLKSMAPNLFNDLDSYIKSLVGEDE